MVGRCSKGRRRRKRSADEPADGHATRRRGPELSPAATDTSITSKSCVVRDDGIPHNFQPVPVSTTPPAGQPCTTVNTNLAPLLNWDSYSWSDAAGLRSEMLFAHRNATVTESAFGCSPNQSDLVASTENFASGFQMGFETSPIVDEVPSALPLTPYSVSSSTASTRTAEVKTTPQSTHNPGKADNKKCMSALFEVMSDLEAELSDPHSSIDKIMHTVKTSTKEVQRVTQLRQWQLTITGPMLALVAIELALILIENIVSEWKIDKVDSCEKATSDLQNPRALLLGHYRAESKEAVLVWRHIITVELRRLRKLVDMLENLFKDPNSYRNSQRPIERLKTSCGTQEQKISFLLDTLQSLEEGDDENSGSEL